MASRDEWPENPNEVDSKSAASTKSSGGCLKVLLIAGGIGALVMVVCCGGIAWFSWGFIPKVVSTPGEVSAVAQQVIKIDIPDDFTGETAVTIDNWMLAIRFANFRHKTGKGNLLIGSMQAKFANLKDQQEQFKRQAAEHSDDDDVDMANAMIQTREFTIQGKKVPFRFIHASSSVGTDEMAKDPSSDENTEGKSQGSEAKSDEKSDQPKEDAATPPANAKDNGKKMRLVQAEIETGSSLILFQLSLEEEVYDEDAVVKMIESMQ